MDNPTRGHSDRMCVRVNLGETASILTPASELKYWTQYSMVTTLVFRYSFRASFPVGGTHTKEKY